MPYQTNFRPAAEAPRYRHRPPPLLLRPLAKFLGYCQAEGLSKYPGGERSMPVRPLSWQMLPAACSDCTFGAWETEAGDGWELSQLLLHNKTLSKGEVRGGGEKERGRQAGRDLKCLTLKPEEQRSDVQ